jgi:hypothetical protein
VIIVEWWNRTPCVLTRSISKNEPAEWRAEVHLPLACLLMRNSLDGIEVKLERRQRF